MYKIRDSLLEEQIAKEKSERSMLLWVMFFIALIMVIVTLNQFVFLTVQVKGQSMQPTLYTDDTLIVNRLKKAERGDIVIIEDETEYWLIKRVIACNAKDVVEIKNDGYVYVNGQKIKESYVLRQGATTYNPEEFAGTITLKDGEIFYLGDNRENSSDSRTYGVCNEGQIVGVVEEWSLRFKQIGKFIFKVRKKLLG